MKRRTFLLAGLGTGGALFLGWALLPPRQRLVGSTLPDTGGTIPPPVTPAREVLLDERGKLMSSPEFAALLARWRDGGRQDVAFVIGGADGIDPSLRARADFSLSFGKMVWPHMLVRVMLAEQIYRAATILGGGPYHRA